MQEGGAALPVAASYKHPDAELLAACAEFQLACVEQRRHGVTDAEAEKLAEAFYSTLARVGALTPTIQEGA